MATSIKAKLDSSPDIRAVSSRAVGLQKRAISVAEMAGQELVMAAFLV